MAYIGNAPGSIRQGRRAVYEFTSTANQTAFSGTDENGLTLDLLQANDNDVYLNGVRLIITDDYTISGDVLTLVSGAAAGDKLIIMTQDEIANDASYSKAASDSRYINYDGDIVNGTIQIGGSGNNITFADNNKAVFGDDSDLQIYHDGDNSYIRDTGTGNLNISGDEVRILNAGNNELKALFTTDGAVELYHDNSQRKLATTSTGIDVTGIVTASGNITAGSSTAGVVTVGSANGFEIQKSGVNGYINQSDSGPIIIRMGSSYSEKIRIDSSGNVGIGTSTPARPLNIVNDAGSNPIQSIRNSSVAWSQYALTRYGTEGEDVRYMDFGYYRGSNEPTRGLVIKSQANATLVTFLDSGNVGIGTSSPAHKLEVAGTAKADQYLLDAIAKDISDTAVDVFIYDTRKDSDGGAWRKRTQHTSWYNETLNTATRGGRKEFPAVAVIVLEAGGSTEGTSVDFTIYDGDDPDMPMWMQYRFVIGGGSNTGIAALNGIITFGRTDNGVLISDFIKDRMRLHNHVHRHTYGSIAPGRLGRSTVADVLEASVTGYSIVSQVVNDVAMTVLPNAPIDSATGLPVPTIAVATDSNVSIIRDNGTVVDITYVNYNVAKNIYFNSKNHLIYSQNNSGTQRIAKVYYDIPPSDLNNPQGGYQRGAETVAYGDNGISPDISFSPSTLHIADISENSFGTSEKLILTDETNPPGSSMLNFITSDYATGWMNGDIKLATLSDTDATNVTGSELVTNGTFDSNISGWSDASTGTGSIAYDNGTLKFIGADYPNNVGEATQTISVVSGETYTVTFEVTSARGLYHQATGGWSKSANYTTGIHSYTVTAATNSAVLRFEPIGGSVSDFGNVDNISVRLAEADRSVNGNGLQVFGTVTKTAVATGAELVGYSGFDNGDYLHQPYNSSLDFSADFCIQTWMYIPSDTTAAAYHYGYASDQDQAILALYVAGQGLRTYTRESGGNWNYIQSSVSLNSWIHVTHQRKSGTVSTFINGILTAGSYTHTANLTRSGNFIRLGRRTETTQTTSYWRGSLALFRLSNTALSQEQIKKIYNDEKFLFQENAKATLYGSSDAVTALAYDDDTELLHVGTSAGRSVFQGLNRIDNTTDAVGAAISASNGMVAED